MPLSKKIKESDFFRFIEKEIYEIKSLEISLMTVMGGNGSCVFQIETKYRELNAYDARQQDKIRSFLVNITNQDLIDLLNEICDLNKVDNLQVFKIDGLNPDDPKVGLKQFFGNPLELLQAINRVINASAENLEELRILGLMNSGDQGQSFPEQYGEDQVGFLFVAFTEILESISKTKLRELDLSGNDFSGEVMCEILGDELQIGAVGYEDQHSLQTLVLNFVKLNDKRLWSFLCTGIQENTALRHVRLMDNPGILFDPGYFDQISEELDAANVGRHCDINTGFSSERPEVDFARTENLARFARNKPGFAVVCCGGNVAKPIAEAQAQAVNSASRAGLGFAPLSQEAIHASVEYVVVGEGCNKAAWDLVKDEPEDAGYFVCQCGQDVGVARVADHEVEQYVPVGDGSQDEPFGAEAANNAGWNQPGAAPSGAGATRGNSDFPDSKRRC